MPNKPGEPYTLVGRGMRGLEKDRQINKQGDVNLALESNSRNLIHAKSQIFSGCQCW